MQGPTEVAGAGEGGGSVDWGAWHASYDSPQSALAGRLALVREQVTAALAHAPPGQVRAISICAGQGHDLIGALAEHPRRDDVAARLVEIDEQNVAQARRAAREAGLSGVEVLAADASVSDAYDGAVPADLVLLCGVLGNISAADIDRTIEHLPQLCARSATVVWTRHRNAPDMVPRVLERFGQAGFELVAIGDAGPFCVGSHRLAGEPAPFRRGVELFEFIGHRALWEHLGARERRALSALFRPDCSLLELVEAVRAIPFGQPRAPTAESMLREARGTSVTKHLFLAEAIAPRFPATRPQLVHRVHRLTPSTALALHGPEIAAAIPPEGLVDVHRYLTLELDGRRVSVDATLPGPPWDGSSPLPLACGPGEDHVAGADPESELSELERAHCDPVARAPLLAALARAGLP